MQIVGEYFSILVYLSVLHDRGGVIGQLPMRAQAVRKKEDLRVKAPQVHITVKIGQVGVLGYGFKEWLPAQPLAQQGHQGRFTDADVTGNGDEFLHQSLPGQAPFCSAQTSTISST